MKKILFLCALLASITASAAVTVTPLSVDYSAQKVTFSVSWPGDAAVKRVWVWIDLSPITGTSPGTFEKPSSARLRLTPAALTRLRSTDAAFM
jgi:P pilus assembly chaperone PapD